MRRTLSALIALLALVVSACAPGGAPAASQSTAPQGSAAAAASGSTVTLEYYTALNEDEPYVKAYKQIIADFEAAHPNIKVNVTYMGRQLATKIRPILQSGKTPDIVDDDLQIMFAGLMKEGLLRDLTPDFSTPAADGSGTWKDQWVNGSLDLLSIPGQLNTVPYWVNAKQVFYDQRLFDKYGLTVPETWDALMADCAKVKAAGLACFGQEGGYPYSNLAWMSELAARSIGGDALLKAAEDKSGKTWLDPAYLAVAQKIYSIRQSGYFVPGFEGNQYPAGQIDWVQGHSVFYNLDDWLPSELVDKAPTGFVFRSFPFPAVDGKGTTEQVEMYQWGSSVFKNAPHPAEAIEFLKFFTSPAEFKPLQTDYGFVSAIKTTFPPLNNADSQKNIQGATSIYPYLNGLVAKEPDYLNKVLFPLNDQLLFNKLTPEQFIQQVSDQTQKFWASGT
jgi:raffinose/stachyose/melibiose transport system substrate-binding protein